MELREKRRKKKKKNWVRGNSRGRFLCALLAFELSQSKKTQAGDGGESAVSLRKGESWKSLRWSVSVAGFFMEDGGGFAGFICL